MHRLKMRDAPIRQQIALIVRFKFFPIAGAEQKETSRDEGCNFVHPGKVKVSKDFFDTCSGWERNFN